MDGRVHDPGQIRHFLASHLATGSDEDRRKCAACRKANAQTGRESTLRQPIDGAAEREGWHRDKNS
jgi:hypothetical protein